MGAGGSKLKYSEWQRLDNYSQVSQQTTYTKIDLRGFPLWGVYTKIDFRDIPLWGVYSSGNCSQRHSKLSESGARAGDSVVEQGLLYLCEDQAFGICPEWGVGGLQLRDHELLRPKG